MPTFEERLQVVLGRLLLENLVLQLRAEQAEAKLAEAAQRNGEPVETSPSS